LIHALKACKHYSAWQYLHHNFLIACSTVMFSSCVATWYTKTLCDLQVNIKQLYSFCINIWQKKLFIINCICMVWKLFKVCWTLIHSYAQRKYSVNIVAIHVKNFLEQAKSLAKKYKRQHRLSDLVCQLLTFLSYKTLWLQHRSRLCIQRWLKPHSVLYYCACRTSFMGQLIFEMTLLSVL